MKKLYENILQDKNVIKEIFSLMKENSILKEYYKFEIEYSFCTGKVIQKKKEERLIIHILLMELIIVNPPMKYILFKS